MAFADKLKKLDAHRLQQSVKATVQSNGRLTFAAEAVAKMHLSDEKSLIIFEAEDGDLGATISVKGDPDGFVLKKCGAYFYVAFKNYLQQVGIDYKKQRIIYDITELDEELDGRTLYKFARRVLPKTPEQLPLSAPADDDEPGDVADLDEVDDEACGDPAEEADAAASAPEESPGETATSPCPPPGREAVPPADAEPLAEQTQDAVPCDLKEVVKQMQGLTREQILRLFEESQK